MRARVKDYPYRFWARGVLFPTPLTVTPRFVYEFSTNMYLCINMYSIIVLQNVGSEKQNHKKKKKKPNINISIYTSIRITYILTRVIYMFNYFKPHFTNKTLSYNI